MDKTDAIDKVVQMMKVSASATIEGERDAANNRIAQLRLTYGISDADLEDRSNRPDEETFFGGNLFFYGNQVRPRVEAIAGIIGKVEQAINKMDTRTKAEAWCQFYNDLRDLFDPTGTTHGVKKTRDRAIFALYEAEVRQRARIYADDRRLFGAEYIRGSVHDSIVSSFRIRMDLQRSVVERIVAHGTPYWHKNMNTWLGFPAEEE